MPTRWKVVSLSLVGAGALAVGAALVFSPSFDGMRTARAEVPPGTPAFTTPLTLTHPLVPFAAGAIKVFVGRDGRENVTVVVFHLTEPRTFTWDGRQIACRGVRESAFVEGKLYETSWEWYAQADDGNVYMFGDVSEENGLFGEDPGDGESDTVNWVVGAVQPSDPAGTVTASEPMLFMPAQTNQGTTWKPEDIGGVIEETATVGGYTRAMRVPAGRFAHCVRVDYQNNITGDRESKWYAQDVGVILHRSKGEQGRLLASTLGTR